MELRQLRYFVAVADELHFSRAADRLDVAQPALSHQIRQLERELGGALFTRTTRAVALTDAGRVLADEGRAVLERVERTRAAARESADDHSGALRVGACPAAVMTVVPKLLRGFRQREPQVAIELREAPSHEQLAALRAGELDAGIAHGPLRADDMASLTLVEEPLMATLPAEHALAGRERLPLEALAGEPFILFPRRRAPALYDKLVAYCRARGFTPRVEYEVTGLTAAIAMVGAGLGVSLLPASLAQRAHAGTAFVPFTSPVPTTLLLLIWRRDGARPALTALRETAVEVS